MEFIEAPAFTRYQAQYLADESFREMQNFLMESPEAGDVLQGTGGFRKLRWLDSRRGKGKRGGLRVIYYHFPDDAQIWFLTVYDNNEADDLSSQQKKALKVLIDTEKEARSKKRKQGKSYEKRKT